jgi:hypothetical protein
LSRGGAATLQSKLRRCFTAGRRISIFAGGETFPVAEVPHRFFYFKPHCAFARKAKTRISDAGFAVREPGFYYLGDTTR